VQVACQDSCEPKSTNNPNTSMKVQKALIRAGPAWARQNYMGQETAAAIRKAAKLAGRAVGASLPSNYGPSADKQNSISQGLVQTINPGPKWATGGALEHLPRPTLVDTTDRLVL
jgi:hypothetical protein